jgi:hypothetical protein
LNPAFHFLIRTIIFFTVIVFQSESLWAQKRFLSYDTSCYVSYQQKITGRLYFSRKFTALQFRNAAKKYAINYLPNTTLNFGIGATYQWATLNLAYGVGFLNPDRGRGKTRYLDLQFHSYGRKIILDVLGEFYNGFYLAEQEFRSGNNKYYIRPDLKVRLIGASVQRVLNFRKFSYRAAFLQNEWQKKNAGSFLVGLEMYTGWINADSTLLPPAIAALENDLKPERVHFFELGPNAGYAYTFVLSKHFFITGSAAASADLGWRSLGDDLQKKRSAGVCVNSFLRFVGGYNSKQWGIAAFYITDHVNLVSGTDSRKMFLNTGNYRLNFIYRFAPGKKTKKILQPINDLKG